MSNFFRGLGLVLAGLAIYSTLRHLGMLQLPHAPVLWMERWGRDIAWALRGGGLLLGAALFFTPPSGDED